MFTLLFLAAVAPPSTGSLDPLLADHWRRHSVAPAAFADRATLLRRLTLDLVGRVPTPAEQEAYRLDRHEDTVRRLLDSPEFAWHFGTVLDEIVMGRYAGGQPFIDYARGALRDRKGWHVLFREVMVGPWTGERVGARQFLERRARDIDILTVDTTRAFFGVDISCARCHNHPLVRDWKRSHYYGMAAFLVRTTGGRGSVGEKADGEAMYSGKDGKVRTVSMTFLNSQEVTRTRGSRREALTDIALEERQFFARALVNRLWDYFFGRGLVSPVDQMHSGNPASVPPLLDALSHEFIASNYDIRHLVSLLVRSRVYRLDSRIDPETDPGHFASARLRPLSPRQMARSLVVALGDGSGLPLPALDKKASELLGAFDPRTSEFQSSTAEALFVSNGPALRRWIAPEGSNLTARLLALRDDREVLRTAFVALLGRSPTASEINEVLPWLTRSTNRSAAVEDLVWALAASGEFRFIP